MVTLIAIFASGLFMCLITDVACMFCGRKIQFHFAGSETDPDEVRIICHECLKRLPVSGGEDLGDVLRRLTEEKGARGFTVWFYVEGNYPEWLDNIKVCAVLHLTVNAMNYREDNSPNMPCAEYMSYPLEIPEGPPDPALTVGGRTVTVTSDRYCGLRPSEVLVDKYLDAVWVILPKTKQALRLIEALWERGYVIEGEASGRVALYRDLDSREEMRKEASEIVELAAEKGFRPLVHERIRLLFK